MANVIIYRILAVQDLFSLSALIEGLWLLPPSLAIKQRKPFTCNWILFNPPRLQQSKQLPRPNTNKSQPSVQAETRCRRRALRRLLIFVFFTVSQQRPHPFSKSCHVLPLSPASICVRKRVWHDTQLRTRSQQQQQPPVWWKPPRGSAATEQRALSSDQTPDIMLQWESL